MTDKKLTRIFQVLYIIAFIANVVLLIINFRWELLALVVAIVVALAFSQLYYNQINRNNGKERF